MDRQIEGRDTADYLWSVKGVVPFLKVDKGLADEADGVQVMKPMPGLDELLARAVAKGMFGTKMRSVIKLADPAGVDAVVDQQFEVGRQILAAGLVPIIEPEVDIHSPQKAEAEALLKAAHPRASSTRCPTTSRSCSSSRSPTRTASTPTSSPTRRSLRVVALSGGYTPRRGQRPPGPQPGRDRQLLPGPHRGPDAPSRATRSSTPRSTPAIKAHLRGLDHLSRRRRRHRPERAGRVDVGSSVATARRTVTRGWATVRHRRAHGALAATPSASTGSSSASPATPATACSSPAIGSPAPAPLFGNDLATLPDFPAEIRAPAGTLAGVSAFQVHISDHEITTPGDAPNVLVAMNPAALRNELRAPRAGRHADRQHRHLRGAQPHQGGLRRQPAHRRQPRRLHGLRGPDDRASRKDAVEPLGVKPRDAERSKNFFALGLVSWMYTRPGRADARLDRATLREQAAGRATPTSPRSRPATPSARRPSCSTTPTRCDPAHAAAGHLHEHHRQHRAGVGPRRRRASCRAAAVPRLVPDHAGVGHPPRAVQAQELRRAHAAGRGRDRRHRRRPRRRLRRPPRRAPPRAGRAWRSRRETMGLAVSLELPLLDHRHPARRPVHRPADQDRGGRPAAWRCTAATASRRCRSSPPTARATASSPPSRRRASRSSTARR